MKLVIKKPLVAPPPPTTPAILLAKDSELGVIYCNFEPYPRQMRLLRKIEDKDHVYGVINVHVEMEFWHEYFKTWEPIQVAGHYALTADPEAIQHTKDHPIPQELLEAKHHKRAAHLAQYRKQAEPLTPGEPDGQRCFEGKLHGQKILMDAGSGVEIAICDKAPSAMAAQLGLAIVKRSEASPIAAKYYERVWAEEHKK